MTDWTVPMLRQRISIWGLVLLWLLLLMPMAEAATPPAALPGVLSGVFVSQTGDDEAAEAADLQDTDEEPADAEAEADEPPAPEPERAIPPPVSTAPAGPVIRAIEFRGNRRVTDDQILFVMRLRPGMEFSPGQIQEDLRRIAEMGVWASPPEFTGEALAGGVKVLIYLEENPPFQGAQVIFEKGPGLYQTGDLERAFINNPDLPFRQGELISTEGIRAGVKALEGVYRGDGYLAAAVTFPEVITEGPQAGMIFLHINEGIIADIQIRGNRKTRPEVIWREITLQTGDVFNARELNAVRRKLFGLQLFDDVGVDYEFTDDEELVLILKFLESRTGQLGFGIGYSSQDGMLGTLSYAERNFRGKGQSIRAQGQYGGPEPEGSLSYFMPYVSKDGANLGIELFRQSFTDTERDPNDRSRFASYDTRRTGAEIRYAWPISRDIRASMGVKFLRGDISLNENSTADLSDISEFSRRGLIDGASHSLTLGITRDTRDFPLDPASGSVSSLTGNYFGGPLGGDFDAVKITAEFKRYWRMSAAPEIRTSGPLERPHVFAARLMVGGTLGNLGLLDRFELGGVSTIRGLEFSTQSGDKVVLANFEYRFPLVNDLSGAVFLDAGTAAQPGNSLDFGEMLAAVGFGIRYRIPFLGAAPLRIDWGYDIENGDSQVVLGFGQMF